MNMANKIYPAVFHKEEAGGYSVIFPDLNGCFSQGETIEEAFEMAKEALALYLDGMEEYPLATEVEKVAANGQTVMLVEASDKDNIVNLKKTNAPRYVEEGLERRGFTQYQAAQILGVNRSFIARIISGERVPAPDMAKRIGLLLDFDWRVFYDEVV